MLKLVLEFEAQLRSPDGETSTPAVGLSKENCTMLVSLG